MLFIVVFYSALLLWVLWDCLFFKDNIPKVDFGEHDYKKYVSVEVVEITTEMFLLVADGSVKNNILRGEGRPCDHEREIKDFSAFLDGGISSMVDEAIEACDVSCS